MEDSCPIRAVCFHEMFRRRRKPSNNNNNNNNNKCEVFILTHVGLWVEDIYLVGNASTFGVKICPQPVLLGFKKRDGGGGSISMKTETKFKVCLICSDEGRMLETPVVARFSRRLICFYQLCSIRSKISLIVKIDWKKIIRSFWKSTPKLQDLRPH